MHFSITLLILIIDKNLWFFPRWITEYSRKPPNEQLRKFYGPGLPFPYLIAIYKIYENERRFAVMEGFGEFPIFFWRYGKLLPAEFKIHPRNGKKISHHIPLNLVLLFPCMNNPSHFQSWRPFSSLVCGVEK